MSSATSNLSRCEKEQHTTRVYHDIVYGFIYCWVLTDKPNSERTNQNNSLVMNMAAHIANRALRMHNFYLSFQMK